MKLEVSARVYDSIVSDLSGIAFLLTCIAHTAQDDTLYNGSYESLSLIREIVTQNVDKLHQIIEQQQ